MKQITRRELFKEMVSKDSIKQVVGAWYGFSNPIMQDQQNVTTPKTESLLEKVQRLNMQHSNTLRNPNGKEG